MVRVEIDAADDVVRVYAAEGLACKFDGSDKAVRVYNVGRAQHHLERMELTAEGRLALLWWRMERGASDALVEQRDVGPADGEAPAPAAEPPAAVPIAPGVAAPVSHAAEVRPAADEPAAILAVAEPDYADILKHLPMTRFRKRGTLQLTRPARLIASLLTAAGPRGKRYKCDVERDTFGNSENARPKPETFRKTLSRARRILGRNGGERLEIVSDRGDEMFEIVIRACYALKSRPVCRLGL